MPSIRTDDINTWYERKGKGYPIVFVHGAFVSSIMWDPQVDYYSQRGYETITYDIRGHGNTGGSPKKKYSVELFADDLHKLLETLGILEKKTNNLWVIVRRYDCTNLCNKIPRFIFSTYSF